MTKLNRAMGTDAHPPASRDFMASQKSGFAPAIFGGMCLVLLVWGLITLYLETSLGWPASRATLGHRAIGWFVNFVLLRTFIKGMRRYYALRVKPV